MLCSHALSDRPQQPGNPAPTALVGPHPLCSESRVLVLLTPQPTITSSSSEPSVLSFLPQKHTTKRLRSSFSFSHFFLFSFKENWRSFKAKMPSSICMYILENITCNLLNEIVTHIGLTFGFVFCVFKISNFIYFIYFFSCHLRLFFRWFF